MCVENYSHYQEVSYDTKILKIMIIQKFKNNYNVSIVIYYSTTLNFFIISTRDISFA